jgi:hypothetical protein
VLYYYCYSPSLIALLAIPTAVSQIFETLHRKKRQTTDIMAELSQLEPVKLISLEGKSCFTPGGE